MPRQTCPCERHNRIRSGGIAPRFSNSGTRRWCVVNFTPSLFVPPNKEPLLSTEYEGRRTEILTKVLETANLAIYVVSRHMVLYVQAFNRLIYIYIYT